MSIKSFLTDLFKPIPIEEPFVVQPVTPLCVVPLTKKQTNRRAGDFGKYYHCACNWYISILPTTYSFTVSGGGGGGSNNGHWVNPTQTYIPSNHITVEQFKTNECCPKCGANISKVQIQVGRPIYESTTYTYYYALRPGEIQSKRRSGGYLVSDIEVARGYYEKSISQCGEYLDRMEWLDNE